jgi:excisionase family DNA binding protein
MDEAAYLQVSRRWVAEAVRQRRIRCTRIGKHVRFKTEHPEELVRAGEQPVTGPPARLAQVVTQDRRHQRFVRARPRRHCTLYDLPQSPRFLASIQAIPSISEGWDTSAPMRVVPGRK